MAEQEGLTGARRDSMSWSRVLTEAERARLRDYLTTYWRLDETSGPRYPLTGCGGVWWPMGQAK